VVKSVENSSMTVNRIAPPFPVSDTGQPWPNPIVVNFEVVERVVEVDKVEYKNNKIAGSTVSWPDYKVYDEEVEVPVFHRFSTVEFKGTFLPQNITWPTGYPKWTMRSSGASGVGELVNVFMDGISTSETNYSFLDLDVISGHTKEYKFLIYDKIFGIHSNAPPSAGLSAGHAWITVTQITGEDQIVYNTYGLWPDGHWAIQQAGLADEDTSDVRINFKHTGVNPANGQTQTAGDYQRGAYNRYYFLSPEQWTALSNFLSQSRIWGYTYTCASFASWASKTVGEEVDANDLLGFGTPREISRNIVNMESGDPTSLLNPFVDSNTPTNNTMSSFEGSVHDN